MFNKKERLSDQLENTSLSELSTSIRDYEKIIDRGPPRKSILFRYTLSKWQYYKKKESLSRLEWSALKSKDMAKIFWEHYISLLSKPDTLRTNDIP